MDWDIIKLVIILSLLFLSIIPFVSGGVTAPQDSTELTSGNTILYSIDIDWESSSINIQMTNKDEHTQVFVYAIEIDRRAIHVDDGTLEPNDSVEEEFDFSTHLDPTVSEHRMRVGVIENEAIFKHNTPISENKTSSVKTPYIEDVSVTESAESPTRPALNVTLTNPSIHSPPIEMTVHTKRTESHHRVRTDPERTRHIEIPLDDKPDEEISGELRLFVDSPDNRSLGMDQIEFEGRIDGETGVERHDYEPIDDVDEYYYERTKLEEYIAAYGVYGAVLCFVLFISMQTARLFRL